MGAKAKVLIVSFYVFFFLLDAWIDFALLRYNLLMGNEVICELSAI